MSFKEQYFNLWGEAWGFHKEFAGMAGTDEDWQRAVDMSGTIIEKYRDSEKCEFIKSLILAVIEELERQDKRKKQQEGKGNEKKLQG